MADMKRIKGRIAETIYPNGTGAITAESHQALLLEMVDTINREKADQSELVATQESLEALTDTVNNLPQGGGDVKADGVYPDLTAGDLAGRGESVPAEFGFRASGGKSIKDGRAYIKRIKGNSVVWNQKADKQYISQDSVITLRNGESLTTGHKYLLMRSQGGGGCYLMPAPDVYTYSLGDNRLSMIFTSEYSCTSEGVYPSYPHIYCTGESGYVQLIDLTQMFQAGNEPTTIEEFNARKPIVADLYAYNEGQVIHCNTESIKSVGDNAWDKYTAVRGAVNDVTGEFMPDNNAITCVALVKCLPGEEYYLSNVIHYNYRASLHFYDANMQFISSDGVWDSTGNNYASGKLRIPSTAHYMRVGTPYTMVDSCMVTLVHSGWKQDTDAGYQPYWQDTLPLPIIRKYFPNGMKLAGSAHDEIRYNKESGKWEMVEAIGTRAYQEGDADNASYLTDGKVTCYPLAKPIVTELDAEDQNFRDYYNVADFGTEQSQSNNVPSAPFSADIIYQFNAVDMIREHEAEITELQKVIATMQAQLTALTNGGQ